jgi:malonyl-CoA O-methyltransferase
MDGEKITEKNKYSMIISGFTFQWFSDFQSALLQLTDALSKDGILLFSIPVKGSFPEWENACLELNLPFRANSLPERNAIIQWFMKKGWKLNFLQEDMKSYYPSAIHFFRSIKNIGAATALTGKPLSSGQMKKLCSHLNLSNDRNFTITYKVMYCCLKI